MAETTIAFIMFGIGLIGMSLAQINDNLKKNNECKNKIEVRQEENGNSNR